MSSSTLGWVSAARTHVGRVRRVNEDAVCARPDIGLWTVADGLGGHARGDLASQAVTTAIATLKPQRELSLMVEFIEYSLIGVNARLLSLAADQGQTVGTTVVALTMIGRHAAFLWAGDSRLYRLRRGQLAQLTTDHSQSEQFIQQGLLARGFVGQHPLGNLLTRAVGAGREFFLDVDLCELHAADRYLLCSDGLDKHVAADEIAAQLAVADVDGCADALIDLTLTRGATDNVTVCVIDIQARAASGA
ncbi:MAG: serine/threonine-protein phosphatase [Gammaproteobacteria bacterium]|nr:serine/threonine-protein phosphatase [Gammaproteobacteria bacterium]